MTGGINVNWGFRHRGSRDLGHAPFGGILYPFCGNCPDEAVCQSLQLHCYNINLDDTAAKTTEVTERVKNSQNNDQRTTDLLPVQLFFQRAGKQRF